MTTSRLLGPLVVALGLFVAPGGRAEGGWTALLDRELSHWRTYLGYAHKDGYTGATPVDAAGAPLAPVGYDKDERGVFTVVEKDGKLALRVSGEIYGCVFTRESYTNYRFRVKVKWGEATHEPRRQKLKDSGILYHSVGEAGVDYWRAWMLSQEFQIMEGHMGDYWNIANAAIDIRAFPPEGVMSAVASARQPFRAFGAPPSVAGFCLRSEDWESKDGGWTDLELVCFEGRSLHLVNGKVVMVLRDSRAMVEGAAQPLRSGRIQLQSEAAEVFFSDIEIQPITSLPAEYAALFE